MLRVSHLISGDLWAGAEAASFHLISALARQPATRVRAVVLNEGELAERLRSAGVEVCLEPEGGRGFRALLRAVRERLAGSDLVHAHRYKEDLLAACSGLPWIATQHGRPEPFRGAAALRMRAYLALDLALKRFAARRVIAVSSEVEQWLHRRVGRARTARIWNGIGDPASAVSPTPWPERPLRVGVLARLVPVKGVELAVDAVARVPRLELEIVGDGPERGALERRVRDSGAADRIHLVGFDPQPLPRVARWRALLATSHHEGNPISVLEALALGTPVVAGDLPGVDEILEGRGGWGLGTRDPEAWARRLAGLGDPGGPGAEASRAARERFLSAFTAEAAARRTRALYEESLAAPPVLRADPQRGGSSSR